MTPDWHEPVWLDSKFVLAVHDRQLAEHGGLTGVRDAGALELAMMRAVNQWSYGEDDLARLAAAFGYGIARNHPFADGNKRTAWVVARTFLALNGLVLQFDKAEATALVQALAAGELSEEELADWFREHLVSAS